LDGKAANPIGQILSDADINWGVTRGPIAVSGVENSLALATPLDGKLAVTGSLNTKAGSPLGEALGQILGGNAANKIGGISIKSLNASAAIHGSIAATAQPQIMPNW